ncbi:MAG: hypothetical protein LBV41_05080 [Cytophagaceae bacterium]|jgi:hypothetical protein|nr:hypothetical protein [Cytophagaceae bacterium]
MNKVQSNYVYMAKAVSITFHKNESLWADELLIADGVKAIDRMLEKIDTEAVSQKSNETPGFTAVKDQKRDMLEEALFRMGGRLKVYAIRNDDVKIMENVRFTHTDLEDLSMNALLAVARTVATAAEGLLPVLAEYKITQSDVSALRELAGATDQLYAERDAAYSERSKNTSQLAALISQLRRQLKLMDTQVEAYIDNEEFLKTYFFARRVHDVRSVRAKKEESEE